jgi:hypothetical protein
MGDAKFQMDATVAGILPQCRSAHASDRGTFDTIWLDLVGLNFRLTPNVDSSKVLEFISWVTTSDPAAGKLTPLAGAPSLPSRKRKRPPRNLLLIGLKTSLE